MSSSHLSIRMDKKALADLEERSRQSGQAKSELAKLLIEEGLRMEAHPGIVFRPGFPGRRPGLARGPDVWQIIRDLKQMEMPIEEAIQEMGQTLRLSERDLRTAIGYYAQYTQEIDEWIADAERYAEEAEAAWLREREAMS